MVSTIETNQSPSEPVSPAVPFPKSVPPMTSYPISALARLENMGLNLPTAKVVQAKLAALSQTQLLRMLQETQLAAQVKPPSLALFRSMPFRTHKTQHSKLLVLDLDDTLVHTGASGDFEVQLGVHSRRVSVRPYACEFLKEASHIFEIAIYTASEAVYADQVLNQLDTSGLLLQHRVYRESCLQAGSFVFKDLRVFSSFALKDIVMVDNSVFGYAFQRANGVPVSTWTGDKEDSELLLLMPYLRLLAPLADVRPFNSAVFSPLYQLH